MNSLLLNDTFLLKCCKANSIQKDCNCYCPYYISNVIDVVVVQQDIPLLSCFLPPMRSILDRLLHYSKTIKINGQSYRLAMKKKMGLFEKSKQ
jgi:hypothetical protein